MIQGWNLAVSTMKPGGKRKIWLPASLAYGPLGSGKIPGNQPLIFEMELISVTGDAVELPKAATAPATQAATMPAVKTLDPLAPAGPSAPTNP